MQASVNVQSACSSYPRMMNLMQLSAIFFLFFALVRVDGSPSGAPTAACSTMIPNHGVPPQTSNSPFETVPTLAEDGSVKITLLVNSQGYSHFRGYLAMAFDSSKPDSNDPIGYFNQQSTKVDITPGNYLNCPGANAQNQNAATHKNNDDKFVVNLSWKPSLDFKGNVTFKTTFVYNTTIFWVKSSSEPIYVVGPQTPTTIKPDGNNADSALPSLTLLAMIVGVASLYHI